MDKSEKYKMVFDKYAKEYQDKYFSLNHYTDALDFLCSNIENESPKLLDLACGPANVSCYIKSKITKLSILGIDISNEMLKLARENVPEGKFIQSDIREVNNLNGLYDLVICGFGFPYLNKDEVIRLISSCSALLNCGGMFFLSTMEGQYEDSKMELSSSGEDTIFIHYHQEDYILAALKSNDFEVGYLDHIQSEDNVTDLIIIAKKV